MVAWLVEKRPPGSNAAPPLILYVAFDKLDLQARELREGLTKLISITAPETRPRRRSVAICRC